MGFPLWGHVESQAPWFRVYSPAPSSLKVLIGQVFVRLIERHLRGTVRICHLYSWRWPFKGGDLKKLGDVCRRDTLQIDELVSILVNVLAGYRHLAFCCRAKKPIFPKIPRGQAQIALCPSVPELAVATE